MGRATGERVGLLQLGPLQLSTRRSLDPTRYELPKSPEGESGTSRRNFILFFMSDRFSYICLSVATNAAIERPIEQATCLVARRAKSVACTVP